jgi:spore coat polysaccharide biosynthesis protein SpsF
MMNIVAIIEARMTSSRLPGKPLLEITGKSIIEHLATRLSFVNSIDEIVLATTTNKADDKLVAAANKLGIKYFRGSEVDVMDRVIQTAVFAEADIIVEVTGDCPLIDPNIVEQVIQMYLSNTADYVTNAHIRCYPDGMDVQVFNLNTLMKSASMTSDPLDHEHVTLHIRNHPDLFTHLHLIAPEELHWPELGLTLDEKKDFELIKKIIEYFETNNNELFDCYDAIKLLRENPDWVSINESVARKGDT